MRLVLSLPEYLPGKPLETAAPKTNGLFMNSALISSYESAKGALPLTGRTSLSRVSNPFSICLMNRNCLNTTSVPIMSTTVIANCRVTRRRRIEARAGPRRNTPLNIRAGSVFDIDSAG